MSQGRSSRSPIQSLIEKRLFDDLRKHLRSADRSLWAAGRIINKLKRDFGYYTKDLAAHFPQTTHRLDEIAATARAFPAALRDGSLTFYDHEIARRAAKRAAVGVRKHFRTDHEPPYERALNLVRRCKHRHGVLAVQEITASLLDEERGRHEPKRRATVAKLSESNRALLAQMHKADCRDILREVEPRSIKLLHIDGPYANYETNPLGVMKRASSASAFVCDSNSPSEAVSLAADLLCMAQRVLVENGVIALWQASSGMPAALAQAIEANDLIHHPFILWDRGFVQLGDPSMGVQYSSEVCYVLTRRGEQPIGEIGGERGQVIRTERRSRRASDFKQTHLMEKPPAVNEALVQRFTSAGDIIFDACGCSASMCLGAERLARRWIYCETNPKNFALGRRNMEDFFAVEGRHTAS